MEQISTHGSQAYPSSAKLLIRNNLLPVPTPRQAIAAIHTNDFHLEQIHKTTKYDLTTPKNAVESMVRLR